MCWDFLVSPLDVLHTLHDIEPPSQRRVRLLGFDLGRVLAKLGVSLGDGAQTRLRFQLVAFRNWWRGKGIVPVEQVSLDTGGGDDTPAPCSPRRVMKEWLGASQRWMWVTLYLSAAAARGIFTLLK